MTPDLVVFDTKGVEFIKDLISSSSDFVTIDEIGYLEEHSEKYKDAVRELLNAKQVIAVIRKDDLDFLTELKLRSDAYVVDLDCL